MIDHATAAYLTFLAYAIEALAVIAAAALTGEPFAILALLVIGVLAIDIVALVIAPPLCRAGAAVRRVIAPTSNAE